MNIQHFLRQHIKMLRKKCLPVNDCNTYSIDMLYDGFGFYNMKEIYFLQNLLKRLKGEISS